MAIQQDTITEGSQTFLYTYSDAHMLIRQDQTGQLYQDAMDIIPCPYTYTETDIPIEDDDTDDDLFAQAGRILLGAE